MKLKITFIYTAFILVGFAGLFLNDETGRRGFYSGAPGDLTCIDCHSDDAHTGTGLTLTGAPTNFVAGQVYPLTLSLNHPGAATGGFQIVATNSAAGNNAMFGTFTAGAGNRITTTVGSGAGRLTHSTPKAFASGNVSWTFNWTAPTTGSGVLFYFAGNASNGDLDETIGDAIYTGSKSGTIPVELRAFDAVLQKNNQVLLSWKTASELNNKQFVLERKVENSSFFEEIGQVKGNGSTNIAHDYTFVDETFQLDKINYYRLRQEDFDGKTTYSKVVSVASKTAFKLKVFPSIVKNGDILNIETVGLSGAPIDIYVVNMNGQIVQMEKTANYTDGTSRDYRERGQFKVSNLPTGRYFVNIRTGNKKHYASFVVN